MCRVVPEGGENDRSGKEWSRDLPLMFHDPTHAAEGALSSRLLREHARTFALTIRALPVSLRVPLGTAYLLARASDTVADSPRMARDRKLEILEGLKGELDAGGFPGRPLRSLGGIRSGEVSAPEERLIRAVPGLAGTLRRRDDREEVTALWRTILAGQLFDQRRFFPGAEPLSRQELDQYCGLVAGSVGAAWTRLMERHCPGVLLLPPGVMSALGTDYGKGLQLLNILRDRGGDLELGRVYVRTEELPDLFSLAACWLDRGREYVANLRGGRVRYASAMPLALARRTLARIRKGPGARITRHEVFATLFLLIPSLVLPRRSNPAS
jgi:farnesyl-diphosphate farnesyltransferase